MGRFGGALVRFYFRSLFSTLTYAGHCYLMMDDLQQAYSAYQQALYHLKDPKVYFSNLKLMKWCSTC